MIINSNKVLLAIGVLGFAAGAYMLVSNVFFDKDFSYVAVIAGLISPLYSYVFWNRGKSK
jgi:hypothetical protein